MIIGIKVYEKDEYLYSLLKERLQFKLPQAYICRYDSGDFTFTNNIKVIFDNKQFDKENLEEAYRDDAIHLYEGNEIDLRRIVKSLTNSTSEEYTTHISSEDQIRLLISFSYIDEREHFIRDVLGSSSFNSMHPIRIDLMSGIRMPMSVLPSPSNNALSNLLRRCTDKKFQSEQILEYLGPSSTGFLSPGKPINDDDVFDIGINAAARLMEHTKHLCQKMSNGALFVAEGWRINETFELIAKCDSLHVLLPARMCAEDTGMTNELGLFKRNLKPGSSMTVYYYEDYKNNLTAEKNYESIRI